MTDAPPLPILACLRWDASGDAALAGLDCAGWQTLMAALRAGQGHAFLDRRLLLSPVAVAVPEWVRSEVHRQALATVARTLRTTSSLSACLGEAGCAVLALKGLDLAHRVYPHPGVRPMGDFDLLVAPEAVAVLDRVLRGRGYLPDLVLTEAAMADPWLHHIRYQAPAGAGMSIEIHWRPTAGDWSLDDVDGLWARSGVFRSPALPIPVHVMAPEDTLLYLRAHIAHHGFETALTQVWDMAEVIRWAGDGFDWEMFGRRGQEAGLTRVVRLCLCQLEKTLGVAVPAAGIAPPPAAVLDALPDVLGNLGGFPRHANHGNTVRLAAVLTSGQGLGPRLTLARQVILPPARELAAQTGLWQRFVQTGHTSHAKPMILCKTRLWWLS